MCTHTFSYEYVFTIALVIISYDNNGIAVRMCLAAR